MRLFGSSGIRRPFSRELVAIALRTGTVIGSRRGTVLVGMDTRTTGPVLVNAFVAGVLSAGGNIRYTGIAPTPSVAFGARSHETGCMVTASHNPEPDNGIKLFNPDGSSFTRCQQEEIGQGMETAPAGGWKDQGSVRPFDSVAIHWQAILDLFPEQRGFAMVIDAGNGAGSVITPGMLSDMGVTPVAVNCTPSGHFARPSEPLESYLPYIRGIISRAGARGAVIHDGDADRMMAFDSRGRFIDGDRLLMLFARYLGAEKVVTTVDTTMAIEEVAEVRRTPVGDSYVSEALLSWGDLGGESSGAWIFPGHSYCPDGPYAAALFCEIAAEWDIPGEIDAMPRYPVIRESWPVQEPGRVLSALGAAQPTEGIRLEDEGGWCLVRASGTEEKIRFTAEGVTRGIADDMLKRGQNLVRQGKLQIQGG
jgi:phosphoglucosamine mutase